jgi:UDP-N-acetylglucosamine 2-epimerase (non-hydrolysing)
MAAEAGRIASIIGTRPEAIKMIPVIKAVAARQGLGQRIILTGQHSGLAPMFESVAPGQILPLPYDPRGRTSGELVDAVKRLLCGHFQRERFDLVLVQGDTDSAVAGAKAAHECGIPIGHIEAGLRSFDFKQPEPEEGNRVVIDTLARLLFAPTETAAGNLAAEWRVSGDVHVTGNTGIDALLAARDSLAGEIAEPSGRPLIVASCHRRENRGAPFESVCGALRQLAEGQAAEIVYLLHPNRHARDAAIAALGGHRCITLVEPLEYREMVRLQMRSTLLLTDSGGLQEEGPALGKPVLVLRDVTERGEALATDNIELVGTETKRIVGAVTSLLSDVHRYARMSKPSFPFGDGKAAPRIVSIIEEWLVRRRARAA